jgi:phage terminase small subunit
MANEPNVILTDKQKAFCKEYILDWNATKAAIRAGYSEKTAYSIGSENLTKPELRAEIERLKINLAEVAEISPLMVLQEYKKLAFSSIADMHDTWIELSEFDSLTPEQKACIQEIDTKIEVKQKKEYNENTGDFDNVDNVVKYVKIKLYDKNKSLDSINKMMGWDAPQKIDLSNPDGSLKITDDELISRVNKIIASTKEE